MILSILFACTGAISQDTQSTKDSVPIDTSDGAVGDTQDTGPVDTGPSEPQDKDQDGHLDDVDCDDLDPDIFPGAVELFDGVDNDCDGVVDAQGSYSASVSVSATGWYEGQRHDFELSCPAQMSRALVDYELEVVCETQEQDHWGRLLLGETLSVRPEDPYLWELDQWSGPVLFESSNGWDTAGQGTLRWTDMKTAKLSLSLDTRYLDVSGSGTLKR